MSSSSVIPATIDRVHWDMARKTTSWLTPEQRAACIAQFRQAESWLWSHVHNRWNWEAIHDPDNDAVQEYRRLVQSTRQEGVVNPLRYMYLLSDDPQSMPFIARLMQKAINPRGHFEYPPFVPMLGNLARQHPQAFRTWYDSLDKDYQVYKTRLVGYAANPLREQQRSNSVFVDLLSLLHVIGSGSGLSQAIKRSIDSSYMSATQMDLLGSWLQQHIPEMPIEDRKALWMKWIDADEMGYAVYRWTKPLPQHPFWASIREPWIHHFPLLDIEFRASYFEMLQNQATPFDDTYVRKTLIYARKEDFDNRIAKESPLSANIHHANVLRYFPKTTAAWIPQARIGPPLSPTPSTSSVTRLSLVHAYLQQCMDGTAIPTEPNPNILRLHELQHLVKHGLSNAHRIWDYVSNQDKYQLLRTIITKRTGARMDNVNTQLDLDAHNADITHILDIMQTLPDHAIHQKTNREMQVALLCLQAFDPHATWSTLEDVLERARLCVDMDIDISWDTVLATVSNISTQELDISDDFF